MYPREVLVGLVVFCLSLAGGQVMFKMVAMRNPELRGISQLAGMLRDPVLWVAGTLYALSTILWIYLLQRLPLSRAYPFVAVAFILVPAAASVAFGERLSLRFLAGAALIVAGVWLAGFERHE
jgi:drug/metabolite transporter (DMT)-like permease